ncbi:MAG TPA: ectonucleotide pyrophosphatase/phosphodiesterase [Rhodanobacteraceae bacterium]|nr:ectonucleotide pyrophosphatase/phosphodiesterase [Rhodanobacteraceae bacterium]
MRSAIRRLWPLLSLLLLGGCVSAVQPLPPPSATTPAQPPAAAAPAATATATARAGQRPPLLLVSIDGFRADYLQRGLTPTLAAMATSGVRAQAMQPSFPSLTFPNHYTLVTGLYPDHHGIVNNTMYDPKLGKFSLGIRSAVSDGRWWSEGEPIWVTADKHGLQTATMFWPGSGAEIHGWRPDHWLPFDDSVTASQRVDQVLQWLDLPDGQRPDFLTLYFDAVDHAGHEYGPDTPQLDASLRHVDAALARLLAGLKARGLYHHMNILVVADHGMAATPSGNLVLMDKVINLDHVRVVSMGVLAGFIPKPGYAGQVAATLLQPHPHMRCWRKSHFPARLHYGSNPRVPPLNCLANVGWQITSSDYLAHRTRPMSLGQHGYDNAAPLMRALFVAHGPAFRKGLVVPEFPNVDVYPLMTHLLGIPAQPNDGNFATVAPMLLEGRE